MAMSMKCSDPRRRVHVFLFNLLDLIVARHPYMRRKSDEMLVLTAEICESLRQFPHRPAWPRRSRIRS
jgi:hypothetical protein